MATYSLAGSGTQALSSGTGALRVTVTSVPALAGNGRANPTNLYDIGLLRQGDGTDWWRAESIDAVHMLLPLLATTTEIGYALLNGATIDVTEVIGTSPFYPPSSPPVSPGSTLIQQIIVAGADAASVTFSAIPATYSDLRLVSIARSSGSGGGNQLVFYLNGDDTAGHYTRMVDDSAGTALETNQPGLIGYIPGAGSPAGQAGMHDTLFLDYQGAWQKTSHTRGMTSGTFYRSSRSVVTWLNTAAITSIELLLLASNLKVGSIFRLYGLD